MGHLLCLPIIETLLRRGTYLQQNTQWAQCCRRALISQNAIKIHFPKANFINYSYITVCNPIMKLQESYIEYTVCQQYTNSPLWNIMSMCKQKCNDIPIPLKFRTRKLERNSALSLLQYFKHTKLLLFEMILVIYIISASMSH